RSGGRAAREEPQGHGRFRAPVRDELGQRAAGARRLHGLTRGSPLARSKREGAMKPVHEKRHPGPATLEPQEDDNPVPEPAEEATWGSEGGGGDYRGSATGSGPSAAADDAEN